MSDEFQPPRHQVRASDSDRNDVVAVLADALGAGQLSLTEFDERSQRAATALTLGDLDVLIADLQHGSSVGAVRRLSSSGSAGRHLATSKVAVFSGAEVRGPFSLGREHSVVAVFGGVELDLREANFTTPEVTISAYAVFGGIDIIVGDGVLVQADGNGIFGGFDYADPRPAPTGSPRIVVKGLAVFGGVDILHR